jgi:tol-pal system-associated acyl-CoA thioesterase
MILRQVPHSGGRIRAGRAADRGTKVNFYSRSWMPFFPKARGNGIKFRTMQNSEHVLKFRVYLEDTDAQGIVYYANYLRYFERGRSEILESLGVAMDEIARPDNRLVVYEVRVKFRRPAVLGDRIEVVTSMLRASEYRITFRQQIRRQGEDDALVSGEVDVVAIGQDGNLKELPEFFRQV